MKWNRVCGKRALLPAAALLLIVDRLTKVWALTRLQGPGSAAGMPGLFSFRFAWNEGVAFSMLASRPGIVAALSGALLLALGAIIIGGRTLDFPLRLSLTAVWAGGVGNFIDRMIYGAVVDFVRLEFIPFPIFNFADICVTLGAVAFAARVLITEGRGSGRT